MRRLPTEMPACCVFVVMSVAATAQPERGDCPMVVPVAQPVAEGAGAMKPRIEPGMYAASVETKGGPLPFHLLIERPLTDDRPAGIAAFLVNGPERQEIPVVEWQGDDLLMRIDYYDAVIRAKIGDDGASMQGQFERRRGAEQWVRMPFQARMAWSERARATAAHNMPERFRVRFAGEADEAVLLLRPAKDRAASGAVEGTFLTTTGDYRYLAGVGSGDWAGGSFEFTLSTFNGVHAFLFKAKQNSDNTLAGDFYSGPAGHTTWTATPDTEAALPDGFGMAEVGDDSAINDLTYTALDGSAVRLGDKAAGGGAAVRILYVMGSWCPNCKDATTALNGMLRTWGPRGLAVTGLAFEVTGDMTRDLKQVAIYRERSGADFPMLLAGTTNKQQRAIAFPVLKEIKAFPTLVFLDARSRVRAVYTGFSGPATGEAHAEMLARFDNVIRNLLDDPADIGDAMPRRGR